MNLDPKEKPQVYKYLQEIKTTTKKTLSISYNNLK